MLIVGVIILEDFYEALDFCAFDVEKAAELAEGENPVDKNTIDIILREAGLDE